MNLTILHSWKKKICWFFLCWTGFSVQKLENYSLTHKVVYSALSHCQYRCSSLFKIFENQQSHLLPSRWWANPPFHLEETVYSQFGLQSVIHSSGGRAAVSNKGEVWHFKQILFQSAFCIFPCLDPQKSVHRKSGLFPYPWMTSSSFAPSHDFWWYKMSLSSLSRYADTGFYV